MSDEPLSAPDIASAQSPIGRWLNFQVATDATGRIYSLAFDDRHIGNPGIRAIHGGVVAAFLELSAQAELGARLGGALARAATISIDFMASTRAADMFARARIARVGRRVAFLEASAWQDAEGRPVATARLCLRIAQAADK